MDNIFYNYYCDCFIWYNNSRKPYSKWTISSTIPVGKVDEGHTPGRKPYSKWTISSTLMMQKE